jgi:hypothetical protein
MPQGLQIWDSSGNLVLDITSRVYKTLAIASVTENTSTTVTTSNIGNTGTIFVEDVTADEDTAVPVVTAINFGSVDIGWEGGIGGSSSKTIMILEV